MSTKRKGFKSKKEDVKTWRSVVFWRDLLLYFVAFSYIGHFIEMGWAWFRHLFLGSELMTNVLAKPYEPYTIYGSGAVLTILIVRPLAKKFKDNIFATFVIATLVCSVLEYISSVVMVWIYGYNPYWWYADQPFNLGGHIWLGNCLLFGLLATFFLKVIYPLTEKLLRRGNQIVINIVLVILTVMFVIYNIGQFLG
jgi:uncharacterized membrane protein